MKPSALNLLRDEINDLSKSDQVDRLLRQLSDFGTGTAGALGKGLTFADNLSAFVKTIEIAIPNNADSETLTPTAPWSQPAQPLTIMRHGIWRRLEGQLTRNGAASGSTFVTLAAADRPLVTHEWACGSSGVAVHQVQVPTTGVCTSSFLGAAATMFFDGPEWEAVEHAGVQRPYPIQIRNDLPGKKKAAGVWVVGAWDITSQSEFPVSVGTVAWQMSTTAEQIEIRDIHDMDPGRKYRVTFIVVSG